MDSLLLLVREHHNQNGGECILREHSNEGLNFVRCFLIGCRMFVSDSQLQDEATTHGQIRGKFDAVSANIGNIAYKWHKHLYGNSQKLF